MTPDVPQFPQPQAPPRVDPSTMLSAMGQPEQAVPDDAAMQIQNQFVDLSTVLQHLMKGVTDMASKFPAFGQRAQDIAQAAQGIHDSLNEGMMDAIKQLRTAEPV